MINQTFKLPHYPQSWYLLGKKQELRRGPISKTLVGRQLVAFQARSDQVAVLDARCAHMGSNLGAGRVIDGTIECPYHSWRFDSSGSCVHIPCGESIPGFARQAAYPVECVKDQIYLFNGAKASYPMPWFDSIEPGELIASSSFAFKLQCPWYMIAANGSDWQHFLTGHDRRLLEQPIVTQPHSQAFRTTYHLEIVGRNWSDKFMRAVAGRHVELEVTVWGGTIVLVKSSLERAQSFGMVSIIPTGVKESIAHVTVLARPSRWPIAGPLVDRLNVGMRKLLIHRFLATDASRLDGTDVCPATLIDADRGLANYFDWLLKLNTQD